MSTKGPKRPNRSVRRPRATARPSAPASPSVTAGSAPPLWEPASEGEGQRQSVSPEAGVGRRLKAPEAPVAPSEQAGEEASSSPVDPSAPFAHYGASMDLSGHYETGRTDSVHVMSIVVVVVACVVGIGVGLGTISQGLMWWGLMGSDADAPMVVSDDGHLVDTGSAAKGGELAQRRVVRAQAAEAPVALKPAPIYVQIPEGMVFHEFEVSCPGGFRARGRFRNRSAMVRSVPPGVVCSATFKGSEYARTPVRAGQNLSCTFGPTKCVSAR